MAELKYEMFVNVHDAPLTEKVVHRGRWITPALIPLSYTDTSGRSSTRYSLVWRMFDRPNTPLCVTNAPSISTDKMSCQRTSTLRQCCRHSTNHRVYALLTNVPAEFLLTGTTSPPPSQLRSQCCGSIFNYSHDLNLPVDELVYSIKPPCISNALSADDREEQTIWRRLHQRGRDRFRRATAMRRARIGNDVSSNLEDER